MPLALATRPAAAPESTEPAGDPAAAALVATALERIARDWQTPPSLEELAAAAGLSPGHFQRLFKQWAGISPKRFAQFATLGHARRLLREEADAGTGLLDAALELGLSGPSRLHDLFVNAEAATPGEFRSGGQGVTIRYGFHETGLGRALVAATGRGLCFLGFVPAGEDAHGLAELRHDWPGAELVEDAAATAGYAGRIFPTGAAANDAGPLPLHLKGTNFQLKVWQALLEIPFGRVTTYSEIGRRIGHPGSARAVGNAVGANRISLVIPCHRVIRGTGVLDNYRWGPVRKRCLLAWELDNYRWGPVRKRCLLAWEAATLAGE